MKKLSLALGLLDIIISLGYPFSANSIDPYKNTRIFPIQHQNYQLILEKSNNNTRLEILSQEGRLIGYGEDSNSDGSLEFNMPLNLDKADIEHLYRVSLCRIE
ncbi:MAG: hypothetical protein ABIB79_02900 [archaeon]